jgi:hypothetical protein
LVAARARRHLTTGCSTFEALAHRIASKLLDRLAGFRIDCVTSRAPLVLSYDLCFHVYNHWYLKLFWGALCFTVLFELFFLYMILRFGRAELLPSWSQVQFASFVGAGIIVAAVTWAFVKVQLDDPLFISYFHLANMAGPPFYAAQLVRRRSTRGTNSLIWVAYTAMVSSWFLACTLWFGPPFNSPLFVAFYCVCIASAALAVAVRRDERPIESGQRSASAVR